MVPIKINDETVHLYDNPGWKDTEGAEQEIPNSFFIKRLLKLSDNVKFIFVVKEASIVHIYSDFLESMQNFTNMFDDVSFLENSIALCVTQVKENIETIKERIDFSLKQEDFAQMTDKVR